MSRALRSQVNAAARPSPARGQAFALESGGAQERVGERVGVIRVREQRGVAAHLRERSPVRGDDRGAARHGLERRQAEALVDGRQRQRRGARVQAGQQRLRDVSERAPRRGLARAHVGATRAGGDELDAALPEGGGRGGEDADVLPRDARREREHVGALEAEGARGRQRVGVRREAVRHAVRHDADALVLDVQPPGDLGAREVRHRDDEPRSPGDRGQREPLPGDVCASVPLRVGERGEVVDNHEVAPRSQRGEVRGAVDELGPAGRERQDELLPGVPGAVGEARPRHDQLVAVRPQRRQAPRHLPRDPLDAARLAPDRGTPVDHHRWAHRRSPWRARISAANWRRSRRASPPLSRLSTSRSAKVRS